MSTPIPTDQSEAKDSLARVLRAYRQQAGILENGHSGNMDKEAINRCMTLDVIGQLRARIRKAGR